MNAPLGPLKGTTAKYDFNLINYNWFSWHDYEYENWEKVDGFFGFLFTGTSIRGIWTNSTQMLEGERWIDGDDFTLWRCLVDHVSADPPTTFEEDRTANPTYWTPAQFGAGDVTGTPPAVEDNLVSFGDSTGFVIKDSGQKSANIAYQDTANVFVATQNVAVGQLQELGSRVYTEGNVPSISGGGTANFLRADGDWARPPSNGGGPGGGIGPGTRYVSGEFTKVDSDTVDAETLTSVEGLTQVANLLSWAPSASGNNTLLVRSSDAAAIFKLHSGDGNLANQRWIWRNSFNTLSLRALDENDLQQSIPWQVDHITGAHTFNTDVNNLGTLNVAGQEVYHPGNPPPGTGGEANTTRNDGGGIELAKAKEVDVLPFRTFDPSQFVQNGDQLQVINGLYMTQLRDDITPELGGPLDTLGQPIFIEDGLGTRVAEISESTEETESQGVSIISVKQGFQVTRDDGCITVAPGVIKDFGMASIMETMLHSDPGGRYVQIGENGTLYGVPIQYEWISTEDVDTAVYTANVVDQWFECTGLAAQVVEDVNAGDQIAAYVSLYIKNPTNGLSGRVQFGLEQSGAGQSVTPLYEITVNQEVSHEINFRVTKTLTSGAVALTAFRLYFRFISGASPGYSVVIDGGQETSRMYLLREKAAGGTGASNFLALTDTPSTYAGNSGRFAAVNVGEDALEFVDPPAGTGDVTSTFDTVPNEIQLGDAVAKGIKGMGFVLADGGLLSHNGADYAAVAKGTTGHVLIQGNVSSTPAFGQLGAVAIQDSAVTNAKMADMAPNTIKLRTLTTDAPEDREILSLTSLSPIASADGIMGQKNGGDIGYFPFSDFEAAFSPAGALTSVSGDPSPALGGDLTTEGFDIILEDSTGTTELGRIGHTTANDGVFIGATIDGAYEVTDGATGFFPGRTVIGGSTVEIYGLQHSVETGRQVYVSPDGILYPVDPPPTAFTLTDSDPTYYTSALIGTGSGLGSWVELTGLVVTTGAGQDILTGERWDTRIKLYVTNSGNHGGRLQVQFDVPGLGQAVPSDFREVYIARGFAGAVEVSLSDAAPQDYPQPQSFTVYVRKDGDGNTYAPELDGSVEAHDLVFSVLQATAGANGDVVQGTGGGANGQLAVWEDYAGKLINAASGIVAANVITNAGASVNQNLAVFNGTTGKLIEDVGISVATFAPAAHVGDDGAAHGTFSLNTAGFTPGPAAQAGTTFLRDDGAWAAPAGGGDMLSPAAIPTGNLYAAGATKEQTEDSNIPANAVLRSDTAIDLQVDASPQLDITSGTGAVVVNCVPGAGGAETKNFALNVNNGSLLWTANAGDKSAIRTLLQMGHAGSLQTIMDLEGFSKAQPVSRTGAYTVDYNDGPLLLITGTTTFTAAAEDGAMIAFVATTGDLEANPGIRHNFTADPGVGTQRVLLLMTVSGTTVLYVSTVPLGGS